MPSSSAPRVTEATRAGTAVATRNAGVRLARNPSRRNRPANLRATAAVVALPSAGTRGLSASASCSALRVGEVLAVGGGAGHDPPGERAAGALERVGDRRGRDGAGPARRRRPRPARRRPPLRRRPGRWGRPGRRRPNRWRRRSTVRSADGSPAGSAARFPLRGGCRRVGLGRDPSFAGVPAGLARCTATLVGVTPSALEGGTAVSPVTACRGRRRYERPSRARTRSSVPVVVDGRCRALPHRPEHLVAPLGHPGGEPPEQDDQRPVQQAVDVVVPAGVEVVGR